jgi:hypothetical protein
LVFIFLRERERERDEDTQACEPVGGVHCDAAAAAAAAAAHRVQVPGEVELAGGFQPEGAAAEGFGGMQQHAGESVVARGRRGS